MTDTASTPNIPNIPMTITVPDQASYAAIRELNASQQAIRLLVSEMQAELDAFTLDMEYAFQRGALPLAPASVRDRLRALETRIQGALLLARILRSLPHTADMVARVLSRPAGVTLHVAVDAR